MEFLKNHYEKVLLSLVLVILTVAAGAMPMMISKTNRALEDVKTPPRGEDKLYEPTDVSDDEKKLEALLQPVELTMEGEHNVVNPIRWKERPDGSVYPETQEDPKQAVDVVSIEPLYFRVAYLGARVSSSSAKYDFGIAMEADAKKAYRNERRRSLEVNVAYTDHPVVLRKVEGSPENPEELLLVLTDTSEPVVVTPTQSYSRIDGYKADLLVKVPSERNVKNLYREDKLVIGDQNYEVVTIDAEAVTVSNTKTGKRTTIYLNPTN